MKKIITTYFEEKKNIYNQLDIDKIEKLIETIIKSYEKDGTVYMFGNGGGSSIAEGFAVDLRTHPFVMEDKSISSKIKRSKVICLTESSGALTGISNDIGFDQVFVEQLKNFMRSKEINKNDILICLSGSGNSKNACEAVTFVKNFNVQTCSISGRGGGKISGMVDIPIIIPGESNFPGQTGKNNNNFHIEDLQNSISHIVVGLFKKYIQSKW